MTDRYAHIAEHYHARALADPDGDRISREIIEGAGITAETRRLLDLGCGEGSCLKRIVSLVPTLEEAVGLDRSPSMLRVARADGSPIDFVLASMTEIPFDDGHFDTVYARFSVHHSVELADTFREVARVTRPGGVFYTIDAHPISGLFLKQSKDYSVKESADFPAWYDENIAVTHPCFTFAEYVEAICATGWEIAGIDEKFGRRSVSPRFAPYRVPLLLTWKLRRKAS